MANPDQAAPRTPALRQLLELWTSRCSTDGGRRLAPRRSEIDVAELRPWLGWLLMLDVLPDGDLMYRVYGTEISRLYGYDLTGRRIRDLEPEARAVLLPEYEAAVRAHAPVRIVRDRIVRDDSGNWETQPRPIEKLLLPFRSEGDDQRIVKLMVATYPVKG